MDFRTPPGYNIIRAAVGGVSEWPMVTVLKCDSTFTIRHNVVPLF